MARHVGLVDVAARAGVSVSTASYVLSDNRRSERFTPETQERVRTAARDLGYVRNRNARSLRLGKTRTVALFHDAPLDRFVERFQLRASHRLAEHDYQLVSVALVEKDISPISKLIRAGACDAAIIAISDPSIAKVIKTQPEALVPTLLVGGEPGGQGYDHVVIDEREGITHAMTTLAEAGRKSVAFAGQLPTREECERDPRWQMYRDFQTSHGRTPQLLLTSSPFIGDVFGAAVKALQTTRPRPDAVFCASDRTAIGIMLAARSLKIDVPDDIAVIGTGNSAESMNMAPSLSSLGLDISDIDDIMRHFWHRIDGTADASQIPVPWKLFSRESSSK
ncbi:LacI family DNA-binding transcriptional regulator [Cutibacterium equinum]|uniref:LacI family DNA-binding transcriptional regulator n=1 Tax=Cutibacterium equinum TaxID=3016342 RepID=A0ABY7QZA1_9ACTN|nr:LacI family DNA-binding transcriptional regulator [Cutibacterium equinum]WCC80015.1 LacI family DNA-binding transcriptional regulator [Cutibacterium equinum]